MFSMILLGGATGFIIAGVSLWLGVRWGFRLGFRAGMEHATNAVSEAIADGNLLQELIDAMARLKVSEYERGLSDRKGERQG